jgi:N-methylhydantoinase B
MTVNTQVDRSHCRPWGLDGGREGTGNKVAIRIGGKWKDDFPNAKVLVAQLKTGDAYRMRSGGGGGHGDPRTRPASAVAEDVRQGYVSAKVARADYGVVVDPVSFAVDEKATQRLRGGRAARKSKRPPVGKTPRKRPRKSSMGR